MYSVIYKYVGHWMYGLALDNLAYSLGMLKPFTLHAFSSYDKTLNVTLCPGEATGRTKYSRLLARVGMPSHVAGPSFERRKEVQLVRSSSFR